MSYLPNLNSSGSPQISFTKPTIEIPPFNITFDEKEKKISKVKRCSHASCKKKLSLTDFPCKCGLTHCSEHRPAEVHNCSYDYKATHNKFLLKTMEEAVVAKKIDQI